MAQSHTTLLYSKQQSSWWLQWGGTRPLHGWNAIDFSGLLTTDLNWFKLIRIWIRKHFKLHYKLHCTTLHYTANYSGIYLLKTSLNSTHMVSFSTADRIQMTILRTLLSLKMLINVPVQLAWKAMGAFSSPLKGIGYGPLQSGNDSVVISNWGSRLLDSTCYSASDSVTPRASVYPSVITFIYCTRVLCSIISYWL